MTEEIFIPIEPWYGEILKGKTMDHKLIVFFGQRIRYQRYGDIACLELFNRLVYSRVGKKRRLHFFDGTLRNW